MALPGSGALSFSQIQTEFTGSNPISLSEYYRTNGLVTPNNTGVPTSGAISVANFYGAVRQFAFAIVSNATTTQNLRTLAVAAGWDQAAPVVATINSGVTLRGNAGAGAANSSSVVAFGANSRPGAAGGTALVVNGSWPGGVSLINNGTVNGGGGGGGGGGSTAAGGAGGAGGTGILVSVALSITNNSAIGGGGGGGAGISTGGGGGNWEGIDGGPGGVGTSTAGGAGGFNDQNYSRGGAGGARGAAGVRPPNGFSGGFGGNGGVGGAPVSGNSYVTWVALGTLYGTRV
jgi:hypothetical protein